MEGGGVRRWRKMVGCAGSEKLVKKEEGSSAENRRFVRDLVFTCIFVYFIFN